MLSSEDQTVDWAKDFLGYIYYTSVIVAVFSIHLYITFMIYMLYIQSILLSMYYFYLLNSLKYFKILSKCL